jgi:release factor glutamine methyltransferase
VTIQQCLTHARGQLRQAGVPDPEADLDARLLAQRVLGWGAARLLMSAQEPAAEPFVSQYAALVDRRATREPMAYVLGVQEFWGLTFEVNPAVLIPRPETEIIVESALELFPDANAPLRLADVGTGSGCLAVALAHARPNARVTAIDLSSEALAVASANAARHRVADRITLVRGDLLTDPGLQDAAFDAIVSNPPYVPDGALAGLQPEVRDHEPAAALVAGPDGLDVIRRLIAQAAGHLRPGGHLIFEIGIGQEDPVCRLISATHGLRMVGVRRDLQGIPRTVIVRRAT